jgi:hypothetical protein
MDVPAMKGFVLFLALLAGAKLAHQEYLFRASARDAIVGAYKDKAVSACQKDTRTPALGLSPQLWANPISINLVIGKSTLDVYLWQVDHEMWNARYRHPYLVLTAGPRSGTIYCEYDIVNAAASVHRM